MSDIVSKLKEKNSKNITNEKKWIRNCPDCGVPKLFRYKSRLLEAIRINKRCASCARIHHYKLLHEQDSQAKIINGKFVFFRICSQCKENVYYKTANHRNQQEKSGRLCKTCSTKNRTLWHGPVERICPNCGNKGMITTPQGYKHAIKKNTVCSTCRNILYPRMTPDVIRKIRLAIIRNVRIKKLAGGQMIPGFNFAACHYFDKLNKKNGWKLQHALNGGEIYIPFLGYWLDAYDKKRNVVVEWYEKHHFRKGLLRQKDIRRKEEIKKLLKCQFIGYDWSGKKIIDESVSNTNQIYNR